MKKTKPFPMVRVQILQDQTTGLYAVALNETRVTPRKDTGRWGIVLDISVDKKQIREATK